MRVRRSARRREVVVALVVFLVLSVLVLCTSRSNGRQGILASDHRRGTPPPEEAFNNLFLNDAQCGNAFPGLTQEVDNAVSQGSFDLKFSKGAVLNLRIEDGQIFILHAPKKGDFSNMMHQRQSAALHQLHRAITTSPSPLPNASLSLSIHDIPLPNTLSFARRAVSSSPKHTFPMPHFSFWSWPLPFIRSIPSAARAITTLETQVPFLEKDPRAAWRGTTWYNNGAGSRPRLRQDLVAKTQGARWADVQALDWETNNRDASNALRIEDFCRYRYIVHTEGVGYSGRLQFHQLCESVILSPPLDWIQHTSRLIKPVFSSTLANSVVNTYPSARDREAWPHEYAAQEANMVFVNPDWSDLEATVRWLENHLDVAAGIARRQRAVYAESGYLSPAAEACYWRSLLRGWSKVARPIGEEWERNGIPFEEFVVMKEEA